MNDLSPIARAALASAMARQREAPKRREPSARKPARKRTAWTDEADQLLHQHYPDQPMAALQALLERSAAAIYNRARALGLSKSAEYLAGPHACRLRRGDNTGAASRFQPGHRPWNAGKKGWKAGGRSAETRFKPGSLNGSAAQRLQPLGAERITKDGIRQRKIREDGPPQRRWKAVHTILWEEAFGPIPTGHIVVFRDRNRSNIQLDNLELITRAENCRRNTIHRYPPELKDVIRLQKKLERTLREASREKQDD